MKALRGEIVTLYPGFDLTEQEIEKFKLWPSGIIPYYIDLYSFSGKFNLIENGNFNFFFVPNDVK